MISLPRTCEKCGNSMYHYGSCEKCPQPPSTDAAKDARIAELEKHNLTMASFWGAKVQGLEAQMAHVISDAEETAWRDEAIALRKRVGELEAGNKASGAICDLALANTDSWKSHAEQAEAQLAEANETIEQWKLNDRKHWDWVHKLQAQLAEIEEKWRLISMLETNLERVDAENKILREALEPFALIYEDHEDFHRARAALQPTAAE